MKLVRVRINKYKLSKGDNKVYLDARYSKVRIGYRNGLYDVTVPENCDGCEKKLKRGGWAWATTKRRYEDKEDVGIFCKKECYKIYKLIE